MKSVWHLLLPVIFQCGWGLFWYYVRSRKNLDFTQSDAFVFLLPALLSSLWILWSRWPLTIGGVFCVSLTVAAVFVITVLLAINLVGS